jgi:hypothetical protein
VQRRKKWLLWTGAALSLVAFGFVVIRWQDRQGVGYLFDLETIPSSVSSANCKSLGLTDTLVTCSFEIAPSEFLKLLVSEPYSMLESPHWKNAHDFPMSANLGPNFAIAWHYSATPRDSPHGGSIDVFADQERRRVLAHLYIE